jgi:hypothetical protein
MTRTRRVAIDGGFEQAGNEWYDSGSAVSFSADFAWYILPFTMHLGTNEVDVVTLWQDGVLSLGLPTDEQVAFMDSGASPIPSADNPGFPGEFFLFDYEEGTQHSSYSYGLGQADYEAPFFQDEAVNAAFFSFDAGFQIILDESGFSIVTENGSTTAVNGYFIGALSDQETGTEIQVDEYPDFFTYSGTAGADTVIGSHLEDRFLSSPGADSIDGGESTDLVSYATSGSAVNINLATGATSGGDAAGDQLISIENLEGSNYADTLTGTSDPNKLYGLGGNDVISGGGGVDYIEGGAGNDTIDGGGNPDIIEGGAGADILDGGTGIDTLSYISSTAGVNISLENATASGVNGRSWKRLFTDGIWRRCGRRYDLLHRKRHRHWILRPTQWQLSGQPSGRRSRQRHIVRTRGQRRPAWRRRR